MSATLKNSFASNANAIKAINAKLMSNIARMTLFTLAATMRNMNVLKYF